TVSAKRSNGMRPTAPGGSRSASGYRSKRRPGLRASKPVETLAQALAPGRERGRALLAAQSRVRGTRSRAAELGGRDPADTTEEAGLLEDRLGEVGRRGVAA